MPERRRDDELEVLEVRVAPMTDKSEPSIVAETRTEYRAIYRNPWSILDPQKYHERGWMEHTSGFGSDKEKIRKEVMRRSEEDHQYIVRWEKRTVLVGPWEEDQS